jgi:homoserine dehydrogenase
VVADVIDEVKHLQARKYLCWDAAVPDYVLPHETYESAAMLRFETTDAAALCEELNRHLGDVTVWTAENGQVAVITPVCTEAVLTKAVAAITSGVLQSRIPVAGF